MRNLSLKFINLWVRVEPGGIFFPQEVGPRLTGLSFLKLSAIHYSLCYQKPRHLLLRMGQELSPQPHTILGVKSSLHTYRPGAVYDGCHGGQGMGVSFQALVSPLGEQRRM